MPEFVTEYAPTSCEKQISESGDGKDEPCPKGDVFRTVYFCDIKRQDWLDAEVSDLYDSRKQHDDEQRRMQQNMLDDFFRGIIGFFTSCFYVQLQLFNAKPYEQCGKEQGN